MNINLLTYDVFHKKTYDTVCLLKAKGYKNVTAFAMPLHYKKTFKPLINHRPSGGGLERISPANIFKNFDYKYNKISSYDEIILPENSVILVCGAGIIPKSIIDKQIVINAHPGYIPNVRGLDALKWAIYEGQPIGVTTHILGDEVDAGEIIERHIVEVKHNDTFHAVAQRQFDMEVVMLVRAIELLEKPREYIVAGNYRLHKRMPHEYEVRLFSRFEKIKENSDIVL